MKEIYHTSSNPMLIQFNETQIAVILRCLIHGENNISVQEHEMGRGEILQKNIHVIRSLLANRLSVAIIDEKLTK